MTILAWDPSWSIVGLLFLLGLVFAVAEIFIPSHGLLTLLSIGSFVGAVVVAFMMGQNEGLMSLGAVALLAPLLVYVAIRVWPHTPIAKKIILEGPTNIGKAADSAHLDPAQLVGQVGVAKTLLRPSGKMVLGDRQIDCMTEGELVPPGRKIQILAVHGAQVVVRAVEEEEA